MAVPALNGTNPSVVTSQNHFFNAHHNHHHHHLSNPHAHHHHHHPLSGHHNHNHHTTAPTSHHHHHHHLSSGIMTPSQLTPSLTPIGAKLSAYYMSKSANGRMELVILQQPEEQHRARYLTEGSRGAIKDITGLGHPVVKLTGCHSRQPVKLECYIGHDKHNAMPHLFYQASKISGKNSTQCTACKVDGTSVIVMNLLPENDMQATIDCVGILKERNVDVEQKLLNLNRANRMIDFELNHNGANNLGLQNVALTGGSPTPLVPTSPLSCNTPTPTPTSSCSSASSTTSNTSAPSPAALTTVTNSVTNSTNLSNTNTINNATSTTATTGINGLSMAVRAIDHQHQQLQQKLCNVLTSNNNRLVPNSITANHDATLATTTVNGNVNVVNSANAIARVNGRHISNQIIGQNGLTTAATLTNNNITNNNNNNNNSSHHHTNHSINEAISSRKRSVRCRLVFRVRIPETGEVLQTISTPIICTQPLGTPEICKKSTNSLPVDTGGQEMFIIGKNFLKDSRVYFRHPTNGWFKVVEPDREFLNSTHLVCTIPAYDTTSADGDTKPGMLETRVEVQVSVKSGGKFSEPHPFTYINEQALLMQQQQQQQQQQLLQQQQEQIQREQQLIQQLQQERLLQQQQQQQQQQQEQLLHQQQQQQQQQQILQEQQQEQIQHEQQQQQQHILQDQQQQQQQQILQEQQQKQIQHEQQQHQLIQEQHLIHDQQHQIIQEQQQQQQIIQEQQQQQQIIQEQQQQQQIIQEQQQQQQIIQEQQQQQIIQEQQQQQGQLQEQQLQEQLQEQLQQQQQQQEQLHVQQQMQVPPQSVIIEPDLSSIHPDNSCFSIDDSQHQIVVQSDCVQVGQQVALSAGQIPLHIDEESQHYMQGVTTTGAYSVTSDVSNGGWIEVVESPAMVPQTLAPNEIQHWPAQTFNGELTFQSVLGGGALTNGQVRKDCTL